jgi:hypothetical protein
VIISGVGALGNCRYCHEKAGFFKDAHDQCSQQAEQARTQIAELIASATESPKDVSQLTSDLQALREHGRFSLDEMRRISWGFADGSIREFVLRSPISDEEMERLGDIFQMVEPDCLKDPIKFVEWPGFLSMTYSNVLFHVLHQQVPHYDAAGFSDFRFGQDEHPILRRYASFAEYRTVSSGRTYQSVGLPIGGGMYYRVGSSQPRTHQTGLVPVADGLLVVTTRALYFNSPEITFKMPYDSILRIESFLDGFGIYPNHGAGKVFTPSPIGTIDEGWYFHNLVSALMAW